MVVSESPESRITAIGGKAWQNDREPGYAVFKFTGAEEVELPGEIYLERSGSKKPGEIVRSGTQVEIKAASS